MTPDQFVQGLKEECRDAAVRRCVETLTSPPGRRPDPPLVELSRWFQGLSEADRGCVARAMTEAADATLFGVLCVLDGVRAIEPIGEKSAFRLTAHRSDGESVISPGGPFLHDILRGQP